MNRSLANANLASLSAALLALFATPVSGGAYKCMDPSGEVTYQGHPCAGEAFGDAIEADSKAPSGGSGKATSIEAQLKSLSRERRSGHSDKDGRKSGSEKRVEGSKSKGYDAPKCAKARAEIRNGYRDEDDKERQAQMLNYHEALAERYCAPAP
jgi:hypothetical protein